MTDLFGVQVFDLEKLKESTCGALPAYDFKAVADPQRRERRSHIRRRNSGDHHQSVRQRGNRALSLAGIGRLPDRKSRFIRTTYGHFIRGWADVPERTVAPTLRRRNRSRLGNSRKSTGRRPGNTCRFSGETSRTVANCSSCSTWMRTPIVSHCISPESSSLQLSAPLRRKSAPHSETGSRFDLAPWGWAVLTGVSAGGDGK